MEDLRYAALVACSFRLLYYTDNRRVYSKVLPGEKRTELSIAYHDVHGRPLDCGHGVMEEAPEDTAQALGQFFKG